MFNTTIKRITALLAAFVIVAIIASAKGADYVKKATWHESMIATRDALAGKRPPSMAPTGLPNLTKDVYTIAAWVRTRSDGVIFAECGDRWAIYAKCFRIEGGTFRMDIDCGGVVSGRSRVSDGQWHHVVLVRTGPEQIIYIDGVDEATGNLSGGGVCKGAVARIGYATSSFRSFNGEIDDLRIYSRALNGKEIKGAVANKCLWAARPDGTGQVEIYGNAIALPPTFHQGRAIPGTNTKFVFLGVPHYPQNGVGTVIRLDMTKNIRTREPMTYITPDVDIRSEGGFWHDYNGKWGRHRLFKEPFPLSEEFFLVSMNVEKSWKHPTAWDICLLSESGDTSLIHSDPEIGLFQPIPLRPRKTPPILKGSLDPKLAKQNLARCVVTDIYHGMEDTPRGSIKYIRINEQIPRPWAARRRWDGDIYDQQHATISKDTNLGLRVQIGVVPVEKDGSAHFTVPADRNIFFQALDENYMEVQRERTAVNYRPGESRSCIGCHETPNDIVSSKMRVVMALKRPPSKPGPQPGEKSGSRPIDYAVDVQPVLDKHCIKCHSGKKPKAGLDLSGTLTTMFSRSYENLLRERRRGEGRKRFDLFPTIGENHPKTGNIHYLPAKSLGSHASILIAMHSRGKVKLKDPKAAAIAAKLAKVHEKGKVSLPPEDMIRLTTWVDANGQYYGTYYGRKNLKYKDHPNFRPVPTFENARSTTAPLPEDKR